MESVHEYELGKAADVLVRELFRLVPDEVLVITADTGSDMRVVNATARAAFAVGAKPMVICVASPLGWGRLADPMLPSEALTGALKGADAWVEFNSAGVLYSTVQTTAMEENKKLRYIALSAMDADTMVRCIGRVDHPTLKELLHRAGKLIVAAKQLRITSSGGTDLRFENVPGRAAVIRDGYADKPGTYMLAGMVAWSPKLPSVNGTLVFDGSVVPPCGKLEAPIRLTIGAGEILKFEGGQQAREFEAYLRNLNHPQMLRLAHAAVGFNPGSKLTGSIVEDERIWGCTVWGIGYIGRWLIPPDGVPAPSHSDGESLRSSVWLDGKLMIEEGQVRHPDLVDWAKRLQKL